MHTADAPHARKPAHDAKRASADRPESRLLTEERGANMVEYALLVALVVMIAYLAVRAMGTRVSTQYSDIANHLES